MVAESESGKETGLRKKPCCKQKIARQPAAVLRQPASWAEVDEYFRWRASQGGKENRRDNG